MDDIVNLNGLDEDELRLRCESLEEELRLTQRHKARYLKTIIDTFMHLERAQEETIKYIDTKDYPNATGCAKAHLSVLISSLRPIVEKKKTAGEDKNAKKRL